MNTLRRSALVGIAGLVVWAAYWRGWGDGFSAAMPRFDAVYKTLWGG